LEFPTIEVVLCHNHQLILWAYYYEHGCDDEKEMENVNNLGDTCFCNAGLGIR
jgi:hypothetical protein